MKMMRFIFPLLVMIALLAGCGISNSVQNVAFGKKDYEKIVPANNALGFQLVKEIGRNELGNIFISPTSLLMALSMVYNGANGETKEEIAQVLQLEGISSEALNKANASLLSLLTNKTKHVELNIANSIWLNEQFHFQPDFSRNNIDYFHAEIQEIDVTSSNSPKRINDWVKKKTNGRIKEIADNPLDPDLVTMLINAIYFKGDWKYAFDKKRTKADTFQLADGTEKMIPFMFLEEKLVYLENDTFQAVSLPYTDQKISMNVFLPKQDISLADFTESLSTEKWLEWKKAFRKTEGKLLLPKFQVEYDILLNDTLKQLGMVKAFKKGADFSKMVEEHVPLWISKVKQKTFINVNEEGAEAAAATTVEVVTESAPITNHPFYMMVNRPFFMIITDDESGTILFMGLISNPEEGE